MKSEKITKLYKALIWFPDLSSYGKAVGIFARNFVEAKEKFESEYGKGNARYLHSEEDILKKNFKWAHDEHWKFLYQSGIFKNVDIDTCPLGERKMKLFKVIIWPPDSNKPGKRDTVFAYDIEEASNIIKSKYGTNNTISIYNEEDATKLR